MSNMEMFFKIMAMIGMLSSELTKAALDGKVTIGEGIIIIRKVCAELGIDFDDAGWQIIPPQPPAPTEPTPAPE